MFGGRSQSCADLAPRFVHQMRYKAAYSPSQLLCPLHYTWHPHSAAKELLDRQAYSDLCQTGGQAHHRLRGAATPQGTGTGKNSVESQSRGTAPTASLESSSSAQAAVTPTGTGRSEAEPELLHTTETSGEGPGVQPRLGAEIQPESREERHLGDGQGVHDSEDFGGDWLAKDESEGEDAQGDSSEQDRGMTDGDTDEGLSLDLSDESGSEPDDGGESGGGAGPGAATLEELGGVPLLLGGTVIPFRVSRRWSTSARAWLLG